MDNRKFRCFAEYRDGLFQAHCIDLCLSAQDESIDEAIRKLNEQVSDYLYDAIEGEDSAYKEQLLSRKSPLLIRLRYYWYKSRLNAHLLKEHLSNIRLFDAAGPMDNHKHA